MPVLVLCSAPDVRADERKLADFQRLLSGDLGIPLGWPAAVTGP
jgi:hypothetical protein